MHVVDIIIRRRRHGCVLIYKFTEAGREQRAVMSPFSLIRSVIKGHGQFFSQQLVHRGHCHTPTDRAMHCRFISK